jgi:predicted nuclease of predicted toxin-antitoxin system
VKIKLDENLGADCRRMFADAGHDVSTVALQAMTSASDVEVIEACGREGRVLVTLDLDISNPFRFPPDRYAGIVVLRLPPRFTILRAASPQL